MEQKFTDVSIDIESAGTVAGYMVVNIGAIYFDRKRGTFGDRIDLSLDVQDLEAKGYKKNPDTMKFWERQPDSVREHCWAGILPVNDALRRLARFLEPALFCDSHIWVKGEHMDIALLEFMYDAEGLPVPWMYRAPKDLRTYELALVDAGLSTEFIILHEGPAHTGIDDAIYQARWVMAAFRRLNQ